MLEAIWGINKGEECKNWEKVFLAFAFEGKQKSTWSNGFRRITGKWGTYNATSWFPGLQMEKGRGDCYRIWIDLQIKNDPPPPRHRPRSKKKKDKRKGNVNVLAIFLFRGKSKDNKNGKKDELRNCWQVILNSQAMFVYVLAFGCDGKRQDKGYSAWK